MANSKIETAKDEIRRFAICPVIAMICTAGGSDHSFGKLIINLGFAIGGSLIGS